MAEYELVGIRSDRLEHFWPLIRDYVAEAIERSDGKYEVTDILNALLARDMQAWAVTDGEKIDALVLTEIVSYPRQREARILACTGSDARQWVHLISDIEAWAKANGCARLEPIARPGWEKYLKPLGFKRTHVVLTKEL